jgi:hypothetical protein
MVAPWSLWLFALPEARLAHRHYGSITAAIDAKGVMEPQHLGVMLIDVSDEANIEVARWRC